MAATNELQLRIKAISDFSDVQSNVQNIQQYLSKLNLPPNLKKNIDNIFGNFEKEASKFQKYLDGGLKSKGDITGLEKSGTQISNMLIRLKNEVDKLQNEDLSQVFKNIDFAGLEQARQKIQGIENELNSLTTGKITTVKKEVQELLTHMGKSATVKNFADALNSGDYNQVVASWNKIVALKDKYYSGDKANPQFVENFNKLKTIMDQITTNPAIDNLKIDLQEAAQEFQRLSTVNLDKGAADLRQMDVAITDTSAGAQKLTNEFKESATAAHGMSSEVDMLKSQVSYFFGLTNAVMLFRRALTEALETVKELDAVMTEMSVVTDLNVGDYWDQLPEYSKRAKELGVSIKDAYSAATLYYQQGLKTNEVVAVSSETLKMARIAGMEAKEATDMMTAALRGFNMEINETSAQRINDVYSELAAVTASDTEEIATAMTKTASIAASANMEFETTSALLAQIIETTREAPETAGTAMKTIIARFTEVKELFSQGQLTGTDEEGEAININKIDAALKSVGMSLSGFLQGTQGIDDIFLELASKWDSLDIATQRYIATMAAGSRQQSRFLAMMSDYDRTMELVEAANNSSGASQEQFNKTLDSLETKLNKLSVAWDTFVMGIANNDIIKFGVDALTRLLDTINKIIDTVSGGSGILKSFFSIGTVAGGLFLGKVAFDGVFKAIGAQMAAGAKKAGEASAITYSAAFQSRLKAQGSLPFIRKYFTTFNQTAVTQTKSYLGQVSALYNKAELDQYATIQQRELQLQRLNLTETQYLSIQSAVNDQDKMAIILSHEQSRAHLLEGLANDKLTDEEKERLVAESLLLAQQKMSLSQSIKTYSLLLFGAVLRNKDKKATMEQAVANLFYKGSLDAAQKSQNLFHKELMKGTLGWYALAAIAVAAAIALIAKNVETAEEKQKRLNKQLETSSEALSEIKNVVKDVEDSFDGLNDQLKVLEGLTEGTAEWNSALIESNNQVLELLQKYPELAQYIENANGVLSISAEGQEEYLNLLNKQLATQQLLNTGLNINKTVADYENRELNFLSEGTGDLGTIKFKQQVKDLYESFEYGVEILDAATTNTAEFFEANWTKTEGISAIDIYKSSEEFDENRISSPDTRKTEEILENAPETFTKYHDSIYELAEESGRSAEEVYQACVEYGKLTKELQVANEAVRGFITSMLAANASQDITSDKQYGNEVIELFNNISAQDYEERFEAARKELANQSIGSLQIIYEDLTGLEASDDWDKQYLKDQIANYKVMEPILDNMEDFYDIFQDVNEKGQKQLIGAIKEDGKGFTQAMIDNYGLDGDNTASLEEIMSNTGLDETELAGVAKTLGLVDENDEGDVNQLVDYINSNLTLASENIGSVFEKFGDFAQGSIGKIGTEQELSFGTLSSISDQLYEVMLANGPLAANNMANAINSAMEGMDQENAEKFASTLANIDWSSTESVEGLSEQLKGLDVAIDETQVEELEKQIIDFADAADNLTFEEAKADMKELKELSEAMADQEGYVFTEELKDQLIESGKAGADDFVMTGIDEWVYIGGSMEELLRSIEGDTGAILGELAGSLEDRATEGAKWATAENNKWGVFTPNGIETLSVPDVVEGLINGNVGYVKEDGTSSSALISPDEALSEQALKNLAVQVGIATEEGIKNWNADQVYSLITQSWQDSYGVDGTAYERTLAEQKSITASTVAQDRFLWDEVNDITSEQNSEQYVQGLEAQMRALDATEEEVADLTDSYIDNGKVLKKDTIIQAQNTVEQKRAEKATADNVKAVSELVGEYEKIAEMPQDIKIKVANEIGLDDVNLTSEQKITFVEDNFKLIQQYAQGSYDAMIQLEDKYRTYVEQMFRELEGFENIVFEVQANGYLDLSQVEAAIIAAGGITDEMQAKLDLFFDSAYYEIEYEYVPRVNPEALAGGISGLVDDIDAGGVEYIKIPKIKRKNENTFDRGFIGSGIKRSSGGGSGSEATNDYDRHYNLDQDINAELREREKLEKEYQDLLEKRHASGEELHKITLEELASLERQKELQEEMLKRRKEDLKRTLSENSQYSEYAKYNYEDQTIEINWKALEELAKSNPDKYEEVSEFISELEEEQGLIQDCEDAIEDTEDAIYEVNERGKDEFGDLQDRVVEALIKLEQDLIDEQEKINESIEEASSDLMDAIQSNIDKFRQDRDNKKTEESIAEKERRLAYLRQDTSGANAMEIKKLEEELADEKESYGDTLIDQAMENLQEQNDAAAEQRERQIELQQSQLDYAEKFGLYNDEALRLMKEGIMNGNISKDSELYKVLDKAEGVAWMNDMAQADWYKNLQQTVSQAYVYAMTMSTDTDYMAEMIKRFEQNGGIIDGEIKQLNALRNLKISLTGKGTEVKDEDLESYLSGRVNYSASSDDYMKAMIEAYKKSGVINDYILGLNAARNKKIQETGRGTAYTNEADLEQYLKSRTDTNSGVGGNTGTPTDDNPPAEPAKPATSTTREYTIKSGDSLTKIAKNELGNMSRWKEIADLNGLKEPYTIYAGKKLKLPAYKTGGLANFTGPAWLDGTKSKPELVLNARDTENFILLKDVLSSLLHLPKNNQNSAPNSNYFDIDVKVDEIGNDYDVDRMIDRVKEKIYEDSMYRNVNSLNLLR